MYIYNVEPNDYNELKKLYQHLWFAGWNHKKDVSAIITVSLIYADLLSGHDEYTITRIERRMWKSCQHYYEIHKHLSDCQHWSFKTITIQCSLNNQWIIAKILVFIVIILKQNSRFTFYDTYLTRTKLKCNSEECQTVDRCWYTDLYKKFTD